MSERTIEIPEFIAFIKEKSPRRLLDIGAAGTGFMYARYVRPLLSEGYTGLDKELMSEEDLNYFSSSITADWLTGPYTPEPGIFDMISCISVIEHLFDRNKVQAFIEKIVKARPKAIYLTAPYGHYEHPKSFRAITPLEWVAIYDFIHRKGYPDVEGRVYFADEPNGVHQIWLPDDRRAYKYDPAIGVQQVMIMKCSL